MARALPLLKIECSWFQVSGLESPLNRMIKYRVEQNNILSQHFYTTI